MVVDGCIWALIALNALNALIALSAWQALKAEVASLDNIACIGVANARAPSGHVAAETSNANAVWCFRRPTQTRNAECSAV
eukprot:2982973-Lingulodinium_polyedra.AAC.1